MERWELENTHAYRIYQNTHRGQYKETETEVEKQERLVRTREYISKRITKVKDAYSYMTIRNQLNAFAQEIGRDNYSSNESYTYIIYLTLFPFLLELVRLPFHAQSVLAF